MAANQGTERKAGRMMLAARGNFRTRLLAALCVGVLLLAMAPAIPQAQPNYFEQRNIEARALETFKRVITLWQEEVYFELYDTGMAASQSRISVEDFAQRMVELEWVPRGRLNPKYLKADFHFRTMVYVTARVPYHNKFNPDRSFHREQTFIMVEENGKWRIDLINLIRSPYS